MKIGQTVYVITPDYPRQVVTARVINITFDVVAGCQGAIIDSIVVGIIADNGEYRVAFPEPFDVFDSSYDAEQALLYSR